MKGIVMKKSKLPYLDASKITVRQGQQAWHIARALEEHSEADVVSAMAAGYREAGRVQTLAEGYVLAGAVLTAYRSTEAGERVPQLARMRLNACRDGDDVVPLPQH
jgi:hypothetical protein